MGEIDIDAAKTEALLDVLRRVIANPDNARSVATILARDWMPAILVIGDGSFEFDCAGRRVRIKPSALKDTSNGH